MDIGKDVLTKTIIGTTDAEKVFTPWWITLHHYLVYTLVVLGLIAVPLNSMLSVNGNCSYSPSDHRNYIYPNRICKIDYKQSTVKVERRFCDIRTRKKLNETLGVYAPKHYDNIFEHFYIADRNLLDTFIEEHKEQAANNQMLNFRGCRIKTNPRLFGFYVYWSCVNRLSVLALYFPYLVLTLALILVLLERMLTRYMWTGQRIDKFYELLVKESLLSGDIDEMDTKKTRQRCQQIMYDFRDSWFYCKAYVCQTFIKLSIGAAVLGWSFNSQCNQLRESFRTTINCKVSDYAHTCSIPANGMNLIIFDLCNVTLCFIVIVAAFNLIWHIRFYAHVPKNQEKYSSSGTSNENAKIRDRAMGAIGNLAKICFTTKLGKLIDSYQEEEYRLKSGVISENAVTTTSIDNIYLRSPDMQMLMNLLAEKEGMWSAILILSIFDSNFKNQFKVRDSKITSFQSKRSRKRKDVTISWNEPRAASFIGQHVPTEHLMYILEIDPPIDKHPEEDITMMPACNDDGICIFNRVKKNSKAAYDDLIPRDKNDRRSVSSLSSIQTNLSSESSPAQRRETKHSQTMTIVEASPKSSKVSLSSRLSKDSRTSTREKFDSIGSASSPWNSILSNTGKKKSSSSSSIASSMIGFGRKHGISMGRRKSSIETPRNFKTTFHGLRSDTEYVIKISFMMSGRKLGSEAYTILSHDNPARKTSNTSTIAPVPSPNESYSNGMSPKTSIDEAFGQRYDVLSVKTNEFKDTSPAEYSSLADHGSDAILTKDVETTHSYDAEANVDDSCHSEVSESGDRNGTTNIISSVELSNILDREFSTIFEMSRENGTNDYQEKIGLKIQNHVRNHLYLLQFSAEWCGLCKSIQPLVHEMVDEYQQKDNISFLKIDVDLCDSIAEEFSITALPSFVIIQKTQDIETKSVENTILSRFIGKNSPYLVKKEVQEWLANEDKTRIAEEEDDDVEGNEQEKDANLSEDRKRDISMPNDISRSKPRKKKSFTSLIFKEADVEIEDRK